MIVGYQYLVFLRRVEDGVFESGFIFSETRNFTLEETIQVVLGQDGFLILSDRENMKSSGLVEQFMASINGLWEEDQPVGWKNTFINNCMSRVEAFDVDDGRMILEAVKNYIAMAEANGRKAREAIFVENMNNLAFVNIFLAMQDVPEWKLLNK